MLSARNVFTVSFRIEINIEYDRFVNEQPFWVMVEHKMLQCRRKHSIDQFIHTYYTNEAKLLSIVVSECADYADNIYAERRKNGFRTVFSTLCIASGTQFIGIGRNVCLLDRQENKTELDFFFTIRLIVSTLWATEILQPNHTKAKCSFASLPFFRFFFPCSSCVSPSFFIGFRLLFACRSLCQLNKRDRNITFFFQLTISFLLSVC